MCSGFLYVSREYHTQEQEDKDKYNSVDQVFLSLLIYVT